MLFSLTKKFLFIANLKTASSSIEAVLAPHAELRLTDAKHGKHLSFADFSVRFKWLLGLIDIDDLFVFGVMRDPVDYVLSIFNSHKGDGFKNDPRVYTGNMDFAEFIATWIPRNPDQIRPQITRFLAKDGRLAANLLIAFDRLEAGLALAAERLDVPELLNLPKLNRSPPGVCRRDLTPDQIARIEALLERDVDVMKRHCNRIDDSRTFGDVRG